MKKIAMLAILCSMLVISLPVTIAVQENIVVEEQYERQHEFIEYLTSPKLQRILRQIWGLLELFLTVEQKDYVASEVENFRKELTSRGFDWDAFYDDVVDAYSLFFGFLMVINLFLFGQIFGQIFSIVLCLIIYPFLAPIGILYCSTIGFINYQYEEYQIDWTIFTLDFWIYATGLIFGPVIWLLLLAILILIVPIFALAWGTVVYLLMFFPVLTRALWDARDSVFG